MCLHTLASSRSSGASRSLCVATGFYRTAPIPYWTVKYSWSTWCEGGYVLLDMAEHTCGVADDAAAVHRPGPSVLAFIAVEVVTALIINNGSFMFLAGLLVYTSRCVPAGRYACCVPSCCRQAQMLGIMVGMDHKDRYEVLVLSVIMRLALCSPDWQN